MKRMISEEGRLTGLLETYVKLKVIVGNVDVS